MSEGLNESLNERLMELTKMVAYFLWEETKHDHALSHWYCAEDIACFLEEYGIFNESAIMTVLRNGIYDPGYMQMLRHIAYRIYIYTNQCDACFNWFAAEHLTANHEWRVCVTEMARLYNTEKDNLGFIRTIRSGKVRSFYGMHGNNLI